MSVKPDMLKLEGSVDMPGMSRIAAAKPKYGMCNSSVWLWSTFVPLMSM